MKPEDSEQTSSRGIRRMGDMWEDSEVGQASEKPSTDWHTDRSRYMSGFDCNWKRLLGYHAFGTGLSSELVPLPLTTGISIHATLERMLKMILPEEEKQPEIFDEALVTSLLGGPPPINRSEEPDPKFQDAADISVALPHAFARIAMPWLTEHFKILTVEEELTHTPSQRVSRSMVPNDRPTNDPHLSEWFRINFNSRPDFTALDLSTEKETVHDFKTASSFQEARELMTYADNVQMMINSMQVKAKHNLNYFPDYYVHILKKGNAWSPSPLIHAFFREGAPPMQSEDWKPKFWLPPETVGGKKRSIGRAYSKQRVSEKRSIGSWVHSMPADIVAEQIIILGPFNVVSEKTQQFMRGLPKHEETWIRNLAGLDWTQWADPNFQYLLDDRFPRTFNCYSYGSRCSFYNLCFKGPGWDQPFENGYVEREPHHTQEPKGQLIT
jgi:hypothetical protein